jgi:hypothetical protein
LQRNRPLFVFVLQPVFIPRLVFALRPVFVARLLFFIAQLVILALLRIAPFLANEPLHLFAFAPLANFFYLLFSVYDA